VISAVCSSIFSSYRFDPTATVVTTPLVVVLALRAGVCQDFAHVVIGPASTQTLSVSVDVARFS
jgi:transglutaminase-like putative cysteine protease